MGERLRFLPDSSAFPCQHLEALQQAVKNEVYAKDPLPAAKPQDVDKEMQNYLEGNGGVDG